MADDVNDESRNVSAPPKWWKSSAFRWGGGLAFLTLIDIAFARDSEVGWGWGFLLGVLLSVAVIANLLVGVLDLVWSTVRALIRGIRRIDPWSYVRRCIAASAGRASFALLPIAVAVLGHWLKLPDRSFIARHGESLDAAVRDGLASSDGFDDVVRHGSCTLIQVHAGIDRYWLVHHPTARSVDELARELGDEFGGDPEHISGPWFSLVD